MLALAPVYAAALFPSLAAAYSFVFDNNPTQCGNLSLSITGAGSPPYSVLIIPTGASPLPNNIEARRITQQNFTGNAAQLSFQLKFPESSQFVAVVSDSTGFGTGGTSGSATVLTSNDASCFDPTKQVAPAFAYSIVPDRIITQCAPTRIWWDPANVQGQPTFQGAIPGGQSFAVPQGNLTTVPEQGLGFTWVPSVRAGTTLLLIGGDNRGPGSAGSSVYIVGEGDNSCLTDLSPSSTPGSPAGGSYPTTTNVSGSGGGGSHVDVGAIVGGTIGGVVVLAAFILVLLFWRRRSKRHHSVKERPVDLLREGEDDDNQPDTSQLPRYYEPEPFMVPDPTVASTSGDPTVVGGASLRPSNDRRFSHYSGTDGGRVTPDQSAGGSTYMRKSPAPPTFRPVNIVQHEDAGPRDGEDEPETIELPPAYTNIRTGLGKSTDDTTTEAATSDAGGTTVTEGTSSTAGALESETAMSSVRPATTSATAEAASSGATEQS